MNSPADENNNNHEHVHRLDFTDQKQREQDRSWNEYKRLVLAELERIDRGLIALNKKMDLINNDQAKEISAMQAEIAVLQTKAGIWGAFGGVLTAVAALGLYALGHKF